MKTTRRRPPFKLIPIPGYVVAGIIIAGLIIFLITEKIQQRKNAREDKADCYAELNREVGGRVTKAFFDDNPDHKGYVIEFSNGKSYRPLYLKEWQPVDLDAGDSIYKRAGAFKVLIYKRSHEHPIVIDDTINCAK